MFGSEGQKLINQHGLYITPVETYHFFVPSRDIWLPEHHETVFIFLPSQHASDP